MRLAFAEVRGVFTSIIFVRAEECDNDVAGVEGRHADALNGSEGLKSLVCRSLRKSR